MDRVEQLTSNYSPYTHSPLQLRELGYLKYRYKTGIFKFIPIVFYQKIGIRFYQKIGIRSGYQKRGHK